MHAEATPAKAIGEAKLPTPRPKLRQTVVIAPNNPRIARSQWLGVEWRARHAKVGHK